MTGYDGNGYEVGDRVELHPGLDLWMRGARFGVVVGVGRKGRNVHVKLDKLPKRVFSFSADRLQRVS